MNIAVQERKSALYATGLCRCQKGLPLLLRLSDLPQPLSELPTAQNDFPEAPGDLPKAPSDLPGS